VNNYEVKAGVVCLQVNLCDPHLSSLEVVLTMRCYTNLRFPYLSQCYISMTGGLLKKKFKFVLKSMHFPSSLDANGLAVVAAENFAVADEGCCRVRGSVDN